MKNIQVYDKYKKENENIMSYSYKLGKNSNT